ncbi:MAG: ferredoxin [Catenulispora sp.]|nr:ferredoxin [Catenulispora sp.]
MLVKADRTKCCGAGMCALNAPEVFDQDPEEGLVLLLDAQPPPELHRAVHDAVGLCPSSAISVEERL